MGIFRITIALDLIILVFIFLLFQNDLVDYTILPVVCGPMAWVTYLVGVQATVGELGRAFAANNKQSRREKEERNNLAIPMPIKVGKDANGRSEEAESPWWE